MAMEPATSTWTVVWSINDPLSALQIKFDNFQICRSINSGYFFFFSRGCTWSGRKLSSSLPFLLLLLKEFFFNVMKPFIWSTDDALKSGIKQLILNWRLVPIYFISFASSDEKKPVLLFVGTPSNIILSFLSYCCSSGMHGNVVNLFS